MMRAVFLDRDGTLVRLLPGGDGLRPPWKPEEVELLPGAGAAVRLLSGAGYELFVVTNQPDAAKGRVSSQALWETHFTALTLLREAAAIRDWWVCMHHPDGEGPLRQACECRKPAPGALRYLAQRHGIALERSWTVGDQPRDMEAGQAAGCRCVMVGGCHDGCLRAQDVEAAAEVITLNGRAA